MNYRSGWAVAAFSVLLISCSSSGGGGDSGGGGGTPTSAPVSTGNFVDSPVQGLGYSAAPSGLAGFTGPNGEFQYRSGDVVTFTIGGMPIGAAAGQPQLTPFSISGMVVPFLSDAPVNIAQLLLGLNTTPGSDRITLPKTPPAIPALACFICTNFDDQMGAAGIPLASEADAMAHLKQQFAILGSWATPVAPGHVYVLTFMPDGSYLLADDDDPTTAGGADGMERGTYRWDATTNVLSFTVAVDTDGTGGLSSIDRTQPVQPTFVIDGTGNAATFHFGPNPADQITFTRVIDATKTIVGAWTPAPAIGTAFPTATFAVLTLFTDGTFTVASDAFNPDPAGMERGTYVFNEAADSLTMTTTVDTNGEFGVNDSPTLPATTTLNANLRNMINGDHTLTINSGPGTDSLEFYPVKAP